MKKLLALSIVLLSLNLYGADKPKTEFDKHGNLVTNIRAEEPISSFTGLEGWGKKEGVNIVVEDYSEFDKTFDVKAIKNQVELKLRLAGIKVGRGIPHYALNINLMPLGTEQRLRGYSMMIIPQRTMNFKYNGKDYRVFHASNTRYGGLTGINYRPSLDKHLDALLLDYLKANPKK
jgi:hypothetical protein